MTRQQRRALERKGIDPEAYKRARKDVSREHTSFVFENYTAATLLVLWDTFGFGKVRAQRFLKQVEILFDDIGAERLSLEDCRQVIKDELDITF